MGDGNLNSTKSKSKSDLNHVMKASVRQRPSIPTAVQNAAPPSSQAAPKSIIKDNNHNSIPSMDREQPDVPRRLSLMQLNLLTSSYAGIVLGYFAQSNLGTSELLRHGMHPAYVSLAFLAGPLSGLVMQPIVGYLSDALRTRRPFILLGAVCVSLSLILFSRSASLSTAVVSFFALDLSLQVVQAPVRACLTDGVNASQRPRANALLATWGAVGQLMSGALVGMVRLWKPWLSLSKYTDANAVIELCALLSLLFMLPCSLLAPSPSPQREEEGEEKDDIDIESRKKKKKKLKLNWNSIKHVPRPFWQVFVVQLCTWSGFFAMNVYANAWVGTVIFQGDGNAPPSSAAREKFEAGVRYGSSASAFGAFISLLISLILSSNLSSFLPLHQVYTLSQIVEALSLLSPLFIFKAKRLAFAAIASFGVVAAVTNVVPWVIVADAVQSEHHVWGQHVGFVTTLFNVSQSLPQLLLGLIAPAAQGKGTLVMAGAGVLAAVGGLLIIKLKVDRLENGMIISLKSG